MNDFIISVFNIKPSDIKSLNSVREEDTLNFYILLKKKDIDCPKCGDKTISYGTRKKKIKHPNIVGFDGNIIWIAHRYQCTCCKYVFMEPNPFSFIGHSISIATERAIMIDLKNPNFTYKDIATRHYVSVSTVQKLFDSWVNVPRQFLSESIGIDEIHSDMAKYGSKFLCVIVDNVSRSLIEILPSRAKQYLNNYLDTVPQNEKDNVRFVTIDMWEPYLDVVNRNFKNAITAVDPYHVVKHLSDAFSRIRINIMNQVLYNSSTYYLLKKWHFLLETACELDNEPKYNHFFKRLLNYRDIYEMLLEINTNLTSAYQLKESYRKFNKEATFENASIWLDNIINSFLSASIPEYYEFTQMLITWKPYIINSFKRPFDDRKLSNALSENMNSQIRASLTVARGVANFSRFRRRMLYAFNKHVFYSCTSHLKSDKRQGKPRGKYNK